MSDFSYPIDHIRVLTIFLLLKRKSELSRLYETVMNMCEWKLQRRV